MKGNFDFDVRVLMCGNCGAPLETGTAGGTVTCGYCDTTSRISPRREEPVEPLAAAVEIDETRRMELLRRQDGIQNPFPQQLQPLISGGILAPWKEPEALAMWQSTCRELAHSTDYSSAELLCTLTIILSNHYSTSNETLRERAMYESALEVLTLPRHRQLMRGYLARNAALSGDIEAAEKWLAPCNPRSQDLESDSYYRVSKAEIETVRENWQGVLDLLGEDVNDVPIAAVLDGKAIIQRANALERLGRLDEAVEQLSLFMKANGTMGRDAVRAILSFYRGAGFQICPESSSRAEREFADRSGSAAMQMANPGGFFGQVFAVVGVILVLVSLLLYFVLNVGGAGAPLGALLGPGIAGVMFMFMGFRHIKAGRRARRLHTEGLDGTGTVISVSRTGWKINGVPQFLVQMTVHLPDMEPYQGSAKVCLGEAARSRLTSGVQVSIKADRKDPSRITLMD